MTGDDDLEHHGGEPFSVVCYWEGPPPRDGDLAGAWYPRAYYAALPDGTVMRHTVPLGYHAGARATLIVTVWDSGSGGSVTPDLASAVIDLEIVDLAGGSDSHFHHTVTGGFSDVVAPPDGDGGRISAAAVLHAQSAIVLVPLDELIRSTSSFVNRNLYEARVTVSLPSTAGIPRYNALPLAISTNLLHILAQKLVLFIPGVMGSRIEVAGHAGQWAWPSESVLGTQPFAWLACDANGEANGGAEASKLDMLSNVTSQDLVDWGLVSGIAVRHVYNVLNQPAMAYPNGCPRLYEILHETSHVRDGVEVPHYIVQPWAYDWRLRLELAVDQMMGTGAAASGGPTVPPYRVPPSLSRVINDARANYPFLVDKIALAGHSTGGLIMRGALQRAGVDAFVDQAFFINVPFYGAPKVYSVFVTGDFLPIIAPDLLQRLAPDIPIFYYLAPTVRYPDPVVQEAWAAARHSPSHRLAGHSTGELIDPVIDELNTRCHTRLDHWNAALDHAAAAYHELSAVEPVIGWDACKVFWSHRASADTPGAIFVRTDTVYGDPGAFAEIWSPDRDVIDGDGTVPSVSQRGDTPARIQILNPHTSVTHDDAANQHFVWSRIASALSVPGPR